MLFQVMIIKGPAEVIIANLGPNPTHHHTIWGTTKITKIPSVAPVRDIIVKCASCHVTCHSALIISMRHHNRKLSIQTLNSCSCLLDYTPHMHDSCALPTQSHCFLSLENLHFLSLPLSSTIIYRDQHPHHPKPQKETLQGFSSSFFLYFFFFASFLLLSYNSKLVFCWRVTKSTKGERDTNVYLLENFQSLLFRISYCLF